MANLSIPRQVAPGQQQGSFTAPVSQGAEIASRDLQALGNQVQQTAQVAAGIWTKEQTAINETRVNDALNRAQRFGSEQQAEYAQLRGENALKADDLGRPVAVVYGEKFDQQIGTIADELELTPFQRQLYERQASVLSTRFRAGAQEHELRQSEVYREGVYTSGVATEQENIQASTTPEDIEISTLRITELTQAEGERLGLPPEAVALTIKDNVGKAHLASVLAIGDDDPLGAQERLDQYEDQMLPSQVAAARKALSSGLTTLEASSWVENFTAGGMPVPPGEPGAAFQMPLPGVSLPTDGGKDYGPRASFRTSNGARASSNHDGVDFSAPAGTPVRAVAGGTVSRVVRSNTGYGNLVEIDHGNGTSTFYAHLQNFDVEQGDAVAPGQTFGRVGSTGNSTGPHLHMGAKRNGRSIDPAQLFTEEGRAAQATAQRTGGVTMPTRAEAEAAATERFGGNPRMLSAVRSEIARTYSIRDAAEREAYENAEVEAYRYMEANKAPPPASVMARLRPGSLNAINNYLEALTAPPTQRSDPMLELALAADPSWMDMTAEEFIGAYSGQLKTSDLIQYTSQLTRARTTAGNQVQTQAASALVVPAESFNRALNSRLDLRGIDRTDLPDADKQQRALLVTSLRSAVLQAQRVKGSQLTEGEIGALVDERLGALTWERPGGMFGLGRATDVTAVDYDTMSGDNRQAARERLRAIGNRNPSEAEVFENYLMNRVNGATQTRR